MGTLAGRLIAYVLFLPLVWKRLAQSKTRDFLLIKFMDGLALSLHTYRAEKMLTYSYKENSVNYCDLKWWLVKERSPRGARVAITDKAHLSRVFDFPSLFIEGPTAWLTASFSSSCLLWNVGFSSSSFLPGYQALSCGFVSCPSSLRYSLLLLL